MTHYSKKSHELVHQVAKTVASVREGMDRLLDHIQDRSPDPLWDTIRSMEFEQDVGRLCGWLQILLTVEPPPNSVRAFWFGINYPIRADGTDSCGLYVVGSPTFDPNDETGDWARITSESYVPEGGYANSQVLHEMYQVAMGSGTKAAHSGHYILRLGYACLAVREVCRHAGHLLLGDRPSRSVAVGFDGGDCVVLSDLV
jgi:hypothetical protein